MQPRYSLDKAVLVQMILEQAYSSELDTAFAYADLVTFNSPVPPYLRDRHFDALVAVYRLPNPKPIKPTLWQRFAYWVKRLVEENARENYAETFNSKR